MNARIETLRLSWALILAAAPALAQGAPETLELHFEDLPRMLSERNQNIKGALLAEEAASLRTGHFGRSFLPQLVIEGGVETFQTGFYRQLTQPYGLLEARVNLFRGGRDYFEGRIREGAAVSARSDSLKARGQEFLETRQAFWSLVYLQDSIAIHRKALEQNEKYLAAANRRIQRGLTSDTDRLEFEINRDVLNEEIESLEHEVLLVEIRLRALLSIERMVRLRASSELPHEHDDELLTMTLPRESSADLLGLEGAEQVAQAEASLARRWWVPSLDLYAGYYLYTLRDRDYLDYGLRNDTVAGVRFTLPLFDGFQSSRESSSLGLQSVARFEELQEEMKHSHDLIHGAEKRIVKAQNYLNRTLSDYDRGVRNSVDVLGALQRLIQFQHRYAELRKEYQSSKAELLSMMGR